jgi:hypothetical protein
MKTMHELDKSLFKTEKVKNAELIEKYFRYNLEWNTIYKYLIEDISPYKDFSVQVDVINFNWNGEGEWHLKSQTGVRKYRYTNRFRTICDLYFSDKLTVNTNSKIKYIFDLGCEYCCDLDLENSSPTIEIFDKKRQMLSEYNDCIFQFYITENMHDDTFTLEGERLDERFRQALFTAKLSADVSPFDLWFEILYCLQRVRFCVASMALNRPYLDNPIWHGHFFHDRYVYPSYATLYDERYFMYCEFTYQALYNFWGRVGDTLSKTVSTGLKAKDIDFSRVIDAIAKNSVINNNSHFLWIKSFKENEYNAMNSDRRQTVHYETVTSKMKREHLEGFSNRDEVEKLQEWIEGRVSYFINHFYSCVEGLRQLTLFWETIAVDSPKNDLES